MKPHVPKQSPQTLTAFLRQRFKPLLERIALGLARLGVTPNAVTLAGLAGNILAAFWLAQGRITWAGWLLLVIWPLDALDGALARLRGSPSPFGGVLDSVTDRYAELLVWGGLLVYYLSRADPISVILIYLAAGGSLMVSYTKARGEAQGFRVEGGLLTRVERFLVLVPCLILNRPLIAIWAIALLANFTALQRLWLIFRQSSMPAQPGRPTLPKE
ncbi:CDP-alcohol phosphatidyltransferase family protein [Thermanaerothrix sp. 4228-RoL]|uniref:CDP-alcohol phosphatidyltransferase family protein n=1 Tax=Thermanaerothrix solaris TaxID=3058434 RepID=A0ABU3NQI5_9CHLR|nr:CDP-alcohol phosphatidyltransferase family protein [Thermanaerothrix sp. 4228-RoL]MDT8899092.1 CDP-alcohol phosphatidyltransferase family protein [Thermanaerothrix sp. 4228-RoL]